MTTGLEIVTKAMQKSGVLVKSETPSADESSDALYALNAMIESWSNDSMMIYVRTQDTFTLTPGTATYSIGTGQTFNTTRPIYVVEAYVRQGVTDYPMDVISDEVYGHIIDKSTQGIPKFLNYTNGYPTGTVKIWPVPDTSYSLYTLNEKQLSSITLEGDVSFPPGWERALIYNLGVEIAPDYGEAVDQTAYERCKEIANTSKADIRRAIMKNRSMDSTAAVQNIGNVYTGWYR